jgi:hypothetical protein
MPSNSKKKQLIYLKKPLNIKSFQIEIPFQETPLPKITISKKVQTSMEFYFKQQFGFFSNHALKK